MLQFTDWLLCYMCLVLFFFHLLFSVDCYLFECLIWMIFFSVPLLYLLVWTHTSKDSFLLKCNKNCSYKCSIFALLLSMNHFLFCIDIFFCTHVIIDMVLRWVSLNLIKNKRKFSDFLDSVSPLATNTIKQWFTKYDTLSFDRFASLTVACKSKSQVFFFETWGFEQPDRDVLLVFKSCICLLNLVQKFKNILYILIDFLRGIVCQKNCLP